MKLKNSIAVSESGFIFDSKRGNSYSANETGRFILNMIHRGKPINKITELMLDEFNVNRETAEKDLFEFVSDLNNFRMLEDTP